MAGQFGNDRQEMGRIAELERQLGRLTRFIELVLSARVLTIALEAKAHVLLIDIKENLK